MDFPARCTASPYHLATIFIRNSDGKRFYVENILIEWNKRASIFTNDLPDDGTKIRRNLHQPFDRDSMHVETSKGNFDIHIIHIGLWLSHAKTLVPISRLSQYSDPSSPLVQTAEWDLKGAGKLSLHRNLASGRRNVVMDWERD